MFEIELKAHVYDKSSLVRNLRKFAKYVQTVERNDIYYKRENPRISFRIRTETKEVAGEKQVKYIFTYKKKELYVDKNGVKSEVNDEKECEFSSCEVLEIFAIDAGFEPFLKKHKIVEDYEVETPFGIATLEICNVEKLGDFIEIEILSEKNDEKTVCQIQSELKKLLEKCGIPQKDIEPRYYSELLSS